MKIGFIIGSIVVVAGTAGMTYYFYTKKKNNAPTFEQGVSIEKDDSDEENFSITAETSNPAKNYYFSDERQDAADAIRNRHTAAAQQMKDAMESILDTDNVKRTENTENLNAMFDNLDKLMESGDSDE